MNSLRWIAAFLFSSLCICSQAFALDTLEALVLQDTASPCADGQVRYDDGSCVGWKEFGDGTLREVTVCTEDFGCITITFFRECDENDNCVYNRINIKTPWAGLSIYLDCNEDLECTVKIRSSKLPSGEHPYCEIRPAEAFEGFELYCPDMVFIDGEYLFFDDFLLRIFGFLDVDGDGKIDRLCVDLGDPVNDEYCLNLPAGFPTIYPNIPGYEEPETTIETESPTPGRGIPPILDEN